MMKVSKKLMVVTGGILTLSVMVTMIGFQISMNVAEAALNQSDISLTEMPVREESETKVENIATPLKEVTKQGEKYVYTALEGQWSPGEKDITVDAAIESTMEVLKQLYDFNYQDEEITVEYMPVIFVSKDVTVDTYHISVNGPGTISSFSDESLTIEGDPDSDGYVCLINAVTGEIISSNKYVYNERINEANYIEDEVGYTVNNQTKKEFKNLALEYLEKYDIYDKDKVKIEEIYFNEYDVRSYSIYFKTDKNQEIIIEISQKSKELIGHQIF